MRYSLITFALLCAACTVFAQNKIETKSGAEYNGTIIRNSEDSLVMMTPDSAIIAFPKSSIRSIDYDVPSPNVGNFWSLGAALGTPAVLHIAGSYEFERFGARLTAGYIGRAEGFQFNFFRKFSRTDVFSHELSVIGGYSWLDGPDDFFVVGNTLYYNSNISEFLYAGLAYAAHFHGAFVELGLVVGDGSFSNPQLMFQIGYMYEFR